LKYLKNIEANINNVLIMAGDFNIRDSSWDPSFLYYSHHCKSLTDIVDSINLCMSKSTNQVPTRYSDNPSNSNSVINLMFLHPNSLEFNNHMIYSEWRLFSDHTPLTIDIAIYEEHILIKKYTIVKNSEKESKFIAELIDSIKRLNTENLTRKEALDQTVQEFGDKVDGI